MRPLQELLRRLRYLLRREQNDADLAEEMRLHIDLRAAESAADGASPSEAASSAQRRFGNVTRLREEGRDAWGWSWLDSLQQDIRYGVRALFARKAFTITALFSLALGVGANTAVFSILNAVMLRSLPVKDPDRLIQITLDGNDTLTNPLWEAIRDNQNACTGMLAYSSARFDLAEQGEKQPAPGIWVSGGYFDTLGISPILGRLIESEDDQPGGGKTGPVVVISYGFWQSNFGGDPNVIGKTLRLDRQPFQVIGVAPPHFSGLDVDSPFSVAIPIACEPILRTDRSWLPDRSAWWLRIVGRLNEDLSPAQAASRLATVTPQILQTALPDWDAAGQKDFLTQKIVPSSAARGFSGLGREHRTALFASMTVVALVLLIACANIANLLLARAASRRQEISVRMALGAARGRIIRQLLTESLLLSLLGLPGGLILARWGAKFLVGLVANPRQLIHLDLSMDTRVLCFTTGIALLTGLLFGLAPAFRATRVSTHEVLKQGARGSISGGTRFHLGKALVAGQIALSLALLVAAGLFLATIRNLLNVPLGFDQNNVVTVKIDTLGRLPKDRRTFVFNQIIEYLRQVPGVVSSGSIAITPISGQGWNGDLLPDGAPAPDHGNRTYMTWFNRVSPQYFRTMRIPLVMGRDFNESDALASQKILILGEKTARECFGEMNPIGKLVMIGPKDKYQVVGVVKDTKYRSVQEELRRTAFLPLSQDSDPRPNISVMIRSQTSSSALIPTIRSALIQKYPTFSLEFHVLASSIHETLRTQRLVAILSSVFGGLALFLALIGLYGVTSYAVAQRQGEIGLRMALGAQRSHVLWLVLRDVLLILGLGTLFGIAISFGAARYLASIVYGLNPTAPMILLASAAVLAIAGLCAGLVPALRASKLDPSITLRQD